MKLKDCILYVVLAFLGGNTTGGVIFNGSGNRETLRRIEYKLDRMQTEIEKNKDDIKDLKDKVKK